MRIISGTLRGRNIKGFDIEGTRPTMDRVKESIFGIIQNSINNSIVLDLFAGSGSLGIEAISTGANYCYFVDNNKEVVKTLKYNISNLNIKDKTNVMLNNFQTALKYYQTNNIKFDIIFIDPPYKMLVVEEILILLNKYDIINNFGLVICEYCYDKLQDKYNDLKLIKNKKYGDTYINIYKYIKAESR